MWVSCNLILLNLSDNFFYIVYFCLYLSISIKLSLLHTHYYRIIIHYFSTFPALPFFFGHLSFVPYYCPTTNKYSTNSFYFSSFTFLLGHPSFVPYYCPTTNKYSLQTLSTFPALPFFWGTRRLFPIIALLPTNILYKLSLSLSLSLSITTLFTTHFSLS